MNIYLFIYSFEKKKKIEIEKLSDNFEIEIIKVSIIIETNSSSKIILEFPFISLFCFASYLETALVLAL